MLLTGLWQERDPARQLGRVDRGHRGERARFAEAGT
jgi:hypothetical protein